MKKINKYVIIGCGGHARSVADVILDNEFNVEIIFLDTNAEPDETIMGYPVLKSYSITNEKVFVAIGDNKKRIAYSKQYYNNLTNIISKKAYIGKSVKLGKGIFVGHHAHIGVLSEIGDFCIINTSAIVEHECKLKSGVFVAPNSTLLGKVQIDKNSFIGANATVTDNIKITDNVIIGAQSIITKDIQEQGVYVGNPGRKIHEISCNI